LKGIALNESGASAKGLFPLRCTSAKGLPATGRATPAAKKYGGQRQVAVHTHQRDTAVDQVKIFHGRKAFW
jgi:hypothetical protein